jgi:hypothetical protein
MLGPHAAYSCSPELLGKVRDKAKELGVSVFTFTWLSLQSCSRILKGNMAAVKLNF